jgi:hypothetical protein
MIAQLHLIAGHGVAPALVASAALLAWGLVRGSADVRVAAYAAAVVALLAAIVSYLTGSATPAAGANAGWLAIHHDRAAYVLALTVLVGLGGIAGFVLERRDPSKATVFATILFVVVLVAISVAASMAFLGSAIRHPSLTSG